MTSTGSADQPLGKPVDALELAWQRSTCRGHNHRLLRADPSLVALNTLQHWLWQRLQGAALDPVTA